MLGMIVGACGLGMSTFAEGADVWKAAVGESVAQVVEDIAKKEE